MLLKISPGLPVPVYKQIIGQVRSLIDQGALQPGQPLPPSRRLAEQLGVNRSTVFLAYAELQALGYLQSRPGSYNYVQSRRKETPYDPERQSLISWAEASSPRAAATYDTFLEYRPENVPPPARGEPPLDLASLLPDPRLYPVEDFRRCAQNVLSESGREALQYGSHQGYLPLRQTIARRLRLHGISVSEEEILITNGAQQGIDLVARVLAGKRRKAVVESPTYASAISLLRFNGLEILGVPMKPDGLDLEVLEKTLAAERPAFLYTMPNFQNPTGITTGHRHREQLLSICLRYRVPLVEDGFEEDMKYRGPVDMPIKSIDEGNIVIYLGTFSKALFPGLRVGWITAEKGLVQRVLAVKRFCDLSSNNFSQMAMHRFCAEGYYDKHLKRLHRTFRKRMQTALRSLAEFCPPRVSWTEPAGGYMIWVKMPVGLSKDDLLRRVLPHGVAVSPGEYYFLRQGPSRYFRISVSVLDEEEIREAVKRLGRALREIVKHN